MDGNTQRSRGWWVIAIAGAAAAVAIVIGIWAAQQTGAPGAAAPTSSAGTTGSDVNKTPAGNDGTLASSGLTVLDKPLGGQEAIDALGEKIEIVAERNGKTVDEIKELLLRDKTASISTGGFILYTDDFGKKG